jgi:hypothetical protein
VVDEPSALAAAVLATLRNPSALSAERRTIASQLFYRAGTATDRAVALIYRLIDLPAAADTRPASTDGPDVVESAQALSATG